MLSNNEHIKFAILYTLHSNGAPMTQSELCAVLSWDNEIVDYFTLLLKLAELDEDGYVVKTFSANREKLILTALGEETCGFFSGRLNPVIRRRIEASLGRARYEKLDYSDRVESDFIPLDEERYITQCSLLGDKTRLLDIKLFVGDKARAAQAAEYFREHYDEVYRKILEILLPPSSEK